MFGSRVLDVRVDQNIDVWEQQVELGTAGAEPSLVVHGVYGTRPVEVDAWTRTDSAHGHQPERRRFRWLPPFQRVIQCSGDERAHADVAGGRFPSHLPGKLVIE